MRKPQVGKFIQAYILIFFLVGALALITVSEVKKAWYTKKVTVAQAATVKSKPEPKVSPNKTSSKYDVEWAQSWEGTVNEASRQNGGSPIAQVTCINGGTTHFCAFVYQKECRGAVIAESTAGEYTTQQAGKVNIPLYQCNALDVLKKIGSQ